MDEEVIDDAVLALDVARAHPRIDPGMATPAEYAAAGFVDAAVVEALASFVKGAGRAGGR